MNLLEIPFLSEIIFMVSTMVFILTVLVVLPQTVVQEKINNIERKDLK